MNNRKGFIKVTSITFGMNNWDSPVPTLIPIDSILYVKEDIDDEGFKSVIYTEGQVFVCQEHIDYILFEIRDK